MALPNAQTASFLSTEDWGFQVTAVDGAGNPFDLTDYDLRASFRLQSLGMLLDDCSTDNGKIVKDPESIGVATLTSYAAGRNWIAQVDTNVTWDLMAYRSVEGREITLAVGRFVMRCIAGVTHD